MAQKLNRKQLEGLSALGLLQHCVQPMLPVQRLDVAEYAERHRYLPGLGGGRGDRWRNDKTPYLVEPMKVLTSYLYNTVAIVGPAQVGKTVVPENYLLHSVALSPANTLWYMQSEDAVEAYVKARINPMIDDHDVMRERQGLRPIDDSLHFKRFRGMSVEFLTATPKTFVNKSAPRVILDEIDAYPKILGEVKALADPRRQAFGDESMMVAISHPDLARGMVPERDWGEGIMAIFSDSDRRIWYWPCPQCGLYSSPVPLAAEAGRFMSLEYPADGTLDEIEKGAHLLCPMSGCIITNDKRVWMNARGTWIGTGQEISPEGRVKGDLIARKTAGFWIVGAMSPFVLGGIGALARARVKAEREYEISGEDEALRQVIVKHWGIPYTPPRMVGSVSAMDLADRAEQQFEPGTVPEGVRFITCAVDCQISTFEYLVRGWGRAGESWVIEKGKILADPSTSAEDWDGLLKLFDRAFPLADGSGRAMAIRAVTIDSQGAPGVTQQARAAWVRWKTAKQIRLYGQVGGREAWSVLLTRGGNTLNAARLQVNYPDTVRKSNIAASPGDVPIGTFNPNNFKDDLAGQLMKAEPGPWYVHVPWKFRDREPPHQWFEQVVAEQKLPNGRWERINPSARNEALDLMVMNHIAAHLHGLSRINWEKPPPWAADWNHCTLVSQTPEPGPLGKPAAAPPKPTGGAVRITVDPATKKSIASKLA